MMEEEEEISPSQEIDFCTMGMFIIGKNGSSYVKVLLLFQALSTRDQGGQLRHCSFQLPCQDDREP